MHVSTPAPQPDNIYDFGAQYFAELLATSAPPGAAHATSASATAEDALGVKAVAASIDIKSLTPAELEPIVLREYGAGAGGRAWAGRAHRAGTRHAGFPHQLGTSCIMGTCGWGHAWAMGDAWAHGFTAARTAWPARHACMHACFNACRPHPQMHALRLTTAATCMQGLQAYLAHGDLSYWAA